ncbi:BRO1-like domain-containing protein [Crepidotus variabilis]|uniref:BRO domain-containing protein 1 n=1 Tax=Crepidotus variabilis TaxID=179855 RepID=A0A9P6EL00_9AGAR|nr:BRO1-like domain-containing protein [Crepidotus variabilis]
MAHQSPTVSIPKKSTDEVDWTTPIRNLIGQSYGENPDNYATECAALQRCRQDAVRGAGSDITARDLLYKYFGQLELLELRFSEIRVNFPWRDAFTNKLITQTSIAYEKASILFQIASTHSVIASSQSRSDPEGLKRAFYYFRACAGMLTYINENFLHAPSTDLSRDVVKFLINLILAQATEVFFEKCTDEKKGNALISKIGSQAAFMYTSLTEEVKEFMGKGIFDRNWVTLLQIKAKYFSSLTQYHRGLADNAAGKYGESLARFIQAETLAKEANRTAQSFASSFVTTISPTLPADAGSSIQDRTKAHLVICSDKKNEASRENDLIYNAIIPAVEALPNVDKTAIATPISIQEVYGTPEVQKTIGQDFFIRLVPLSVHESASVYSEEKAKLVRGEVEKADLADSEGRSAIDGLGVREGLTRFKAMADGDLTGREEVPLDVRRWKEDIAVVEERESVAGLIAELNKLKTTVSNDLQSISRDLDVESRDCEMMRVKYEHLWSQAPSATITKSQRQDLKSHFGALEAAASSDQQVAAIWDAVRSDIGLLLSPQVEQVFEERGGSKQDDLLDLDLTSVEADDTAERSKIKTYVDEIEDRLERLRMIEKERKEVLKDLKEKVQTDDVSHLLLLNRRNTGVEPTLFAAELEKFRPYQQRLASTVHHQEAALQEIQTFWKGLKDLAGRGPGARKWEEREKKKKDTVKRFQRARDGYMEVRDGLAKGLQFYNDLTDLTNKLRSSVRSYVAERTSERESLVAKLETEKRFSSSVSSPPPPLAAKPPLPLPPQSRPAIESAFSSMSIGAQPSQPRPAQAWQTQAASPPPPPPSHQTYSPSPYGAGSAPSPMSTSSRYSSGLPPPPPPPPPQQATQYSYQSFNTPSHYTPSPAPPQRQSTQQQSFFPPPPSQPPTHSHSHSSAYSTPSAPPPPPSDPYASLAMFNPSTTSPPPAPSSAPPPPVSSQTSHQTGYGSYTGQQHGYGVTPPPPPQQPQQQYYQSQYQSTPSTPSGFPPPPPPPGQPQQFMGYQQQAPPPPPPGNGYNYQQGYGR